MLLLKRSLGSLDKMTGSAAAICNNEETSMKKIAKDSITESERTRSLMALLSCYTSLKTV